MINYQLSGIQEDEAGDITFIPRATFNDPDPIIPLTFKGSIIHDMISRQTEVLAYAAQLKVSFPQSAPPLLRGIGIADDDNDHKEGPFWTYRKMSLETTLSRAYLRLPEVIASRCYQAKPNID